MKIIIATSSLTYVPQNYNNVLEYILINADENIAGIVLLKINLWKALLKLPYLYFANCKNMAKTLAQNIGDVLLKRKEKILIKYDIPFIYAKNINEPQIIAWIKKNNPDLILNLRTRSIYKEQVLSIPRLGCVNLHHGILPQQRGLFCDLYSLGYNKKTGFTFHEMTKQIDGGQIFQKEIVEKNLDYMRYLLRCSEKESKAVVRFINQVVQDKSLPKGKINESDQFFVTSTPTFKTIKKIQNNGIIL